MAKKEPVPQYMQNRAMGALGMAIGAAILVISLTDVFTGETYLGVFNSIFALVGFSLIVFGLLKIFFNRHGEEGEK